MHSTKKPDNQVEQVGQRFPFGAVGVFILGSLLFGLEFGGPQAVTGLSVGLFCVASVLLIAGRLGKAWQLALLALLTGIILIYRMACWQALFDWALWAGLLAWLFWPVQRPSRGERVSAVPSPVLYWPWYVRPLFRLDRYVCPLPVSAATLQASWAPPPPHVDSAQLEALFGTRAELESLRLRGSAAFEAAVLSDARLTAVGRLFFRLNCSRFLTRRNMVVDYYLQRRAAIAACPHKDVVAPFVIVGLPRTGSTLLQRLLACDPRSRAVHTFELENPVPPLPAGLAPLDDPRLKNQRDTARLLDLLAPGLVEGFRKSHPWLPAEPEEELMYALGQHGVWPVFAQPLGAQRAYVEWALDASDKRPVFKYLHRFLELLSFARPTEQWVLKCPAYSLYPALLVDEFPDARVVVTHRNPFEAVASRAKLCVAVLSGFFDDYSLDKHQIGKETLLWCRQLAMNVMLYRRQHPATADRQFLDVYYTDIESSPVATVQRIYDHYGVDFTDQHRQNIAQLMDRDPRISHGRASYSLEEFGLTHEQVQQAFQPYLQQYFPDLAAPSS